LFGSGGMNGCNRLLLELSASLLCAGRKLDQRRPGRVAVLILVLTRGETDPLLVTLPVPGTISKNEPDIAEFEVDKTLERVFFKAAKENTTDHGSLGDDGGDVLGERDDGGDEEGCAPGLGVDQRHGTPRARGASATL
jgi:hypothetical protein